MSVSPSLSYYTYASPHGPLTIQASHVGITAVAFNDHAMAGAHAACALTNKAATQIHEYLAGKRFDFDCTLDLQGSDFQIRVWHETEAIPYGQVVTARDIATRIGNPQAYRSVGSALRHCTLTPLIPVHRVLQPTTDPHSTLYEAFRALEHASEHTSGQSSS